MTVGRKRNYELNDTTMGIDIYARWRGQREEEREAQCTGFSVYDGHVGYLREAYHGEPYATRFFVREAFEHPLHQARISAATLRTRLNDTLVLIEQREMDVYGVTERADILRVQQSYVDFVELCEAKERQTGEPCTIVASY